MPLNADDTIVPPPDSDLEFDATAADIPGPPPSSEAPGPVKEPLDQPGDEEQTPRSVSDVPPPPAFDERYKEPFVGLLYVGYLEEDFTLFGHHFRISTPSRRERIQMGLVMKEYQDTMTWELAWQAAVVAAHLIEVDHMPLPEPVTKKATRTPFMERFEWVQDNLQDRVIDEVYTKCMEMRDTVDNVVEAMGKAPG